MTDVPVGLSHTLTMVVDERVLVPAVFPDDPLFQAMPPVLATAFLVGLLERACIAALAPHLPVHLRTVGTHMDVSHAAATPAGLRVSAEVTLEAVDGRRLWRDNHGENGVNQDETGMPPT